MQQILRHGIRGALRLSAARRRGVFRTSHAATVYCRAKSSAAKDTTDVNAQKTKVLEKLVSDINSKYGRGSLMKLGDTNYPKVETTSTGALALDVALGGGVPKGRIIEIYGPESSGKTTLALHCIAEVQKTGGNVVFIDAEHAFDVTYASNLGLDVESLYLSQPDCGDEALRLADVLARSGAVQMICIDSVSALVPRAELEGEIGAVTIGAQARMMSSALKQLAKSASKHGCTIVFINQIRYKVGVMYGNPETTSGGIALKFYASARMEVRRKDKIMDGTEQVGIKVRCKVLKNKVAPPFKHADLDIIFGKGIHTVGSLLDAAELYDVVQRKGSYYYKGETKLGQGREKAVKFLTENQDVFNEIDKLTREKVAAAQTGGADYGSLEYKEESEPTVSTLPPELTESEDAGDSEPVLAEQTS